MPETSSPRLRRNDQLRAMSRWEQEAQIQQYAAELVGVYAELKKWRAQKYLLKSKILGIKNVMNPWFKPGGKGDFVWYNLSCMAYRRGYPTQESRDAKWAVVDPQGRTARDFWFRFGVKQQAAENLKDRPDLKLVFSKPWFRVSTNEVYTAIQLFKEHGVKFIHLSLKLPARPLNRRLGVTDLDGYRIIRTVSGAAIPDIVKEVYGKRIRTLGIPKGRENRKASAPKVRADRGPVQAAEGGGLPAGDGRDVLLGTSGDICSVATEGTGTGGGSGATGGAEQIEKIEPETPADSSGLGGTACQ